MVAVAGLAAACANTVKRVDVDGGTSDVVVLGDVVVAARPGEKVILRHAGRAVTHAFVGPGSSLPPLFAPQAGGLVPTPDVWGRKGPPTWDGRTYWSTGAIQPSSLSEIPLAENISDGDHILTCALHPQLRVVVRVGGEGSSTPDPSPVIDAALAAVRDEVEGSDVTVTAGVTTDDAFVAAFSPRTVRIPVGGSVTWRAGARTPVDVVFGPRPSLSRTVPPDGLPTGKASGWDGTGILRSGYLSADPEAGTEASEWTVRFMKAGRYTYASRFGDAMTGTVVVEP